MADRVRVEITGDSSSLVSASARAERAIRGVGNETRAQTRAATAFNGAATRQAKTTGLMGSQAAMAAKSWAKYAASAAAAMAAGAAIRKIAQDTLDFDAAMRNVNSIAQLNEKAFKRLEDRVLNLAGPTAQAPKTLAEGLYDLVSSGFKANEAVKVLGVSAKAATAGLTDTATSVRGVAAVLNAYQMGAGQAGHVSDLLFQTVNRGVITFEELASQIGDVLPFAATLNVGLDQVGGAIATMTKEGLSGAKATTRLKQAMVAFIKPSEGLKSTLQDLGYQSGAQIIAQKGFQGALEAVTEAAGGNQAAIAKLFPDIRGLGGALALTGENAKAAEGDLASMAKAGGATDKALSQQSQSISYQWNKLKAEASALAIRVGFAFIKVVKDIAHARGAVGKTVHDIATFLGPVLARIFDGVKRMFQGMFKTIASAMQLIGDLLHGRWSKIWDDVKGIFEGFFRWLGGVGKLLVTPLRAAAQLVDSALTSAFGGMWTGIKGVFTDGANAVIDVMNTLLDILDKVPFVDVGSIGHIGGGVANPAGGGNVAKGRHFKAQGGFLGGSGLADTVPIMAAPGEAILNRHQQGPVEAALRATYGFGLGELFRREQRPHYMAKGGHVDVQHFGIGGVVEDAIGAVGGAAKSVLRNVVGATGSGAKWLASQLPSAPPPFAAFPGWASGLAAEWLTGKTKKFGKLHGAPKGAGPLGKVGNLPRNFADLAKRWQPSHPRWDVWQMGLLLQSMGFDVAENPHFGGVHPVHTAGSYHYSGRAIDVNWPTGGATELAKFQAIAPFVARFGPKDPLIEDAGTSNQHFHYAYARGGFVGRALRRFARGGRVGNINHIYPQTSGFPGGGYQLPGYVIARLAEHFGMPGRTMEQITRGESDRQPGAVGTDPGGTHGLGLWMITTGYNDGLIRRLGGVDAMRNPVQNAKAAASIWKSQGIGAWYGTKFVTGNNLHYSGKFTDADLVRAIGGGGGGGSSKPETGLGKGIAIQGLDPAVAVLGLDQARVASFGRFLPRSIHIPPSVRKLPKWLQRQLATRGLTYGQIAAIADSAIQAAQNTGGGTDDRAARTFQIDIEKRRIRQVANAIKAVRKSLRTKGLGPKQTKKLRGQLLGLMSLYRGLRIDIGSGLGDLGADDSTTKDLLAAQLLSARQESALSQAQYGVFAGMLSGLGGPFVGAFAHGGRVPRTGLALVHRDEMIQPDPEGPFARSPAAVAGRGEAPEVTLVLSGDAGKLVKLIDARVDGRAAKVTNARLGRQARRISVAPGVA